MAGLYDAFFSNVGHRVETVSEGLACMTRIRESPPDLLLLDQGLPPGGEATACSPVFGKKMP